MLHKMQQFKKTYHFISVLVDRDPIIVLTYQSYKRLIEHKHTDKHDKLILPFATTAASGIDGCQEN